MKSYKITVNGRSYEVTVEELGGAASPAPKAAAPRRAAPIASAPRAQAPAAASTEAQSARGAGSQVKAPMPGTLLAYKVAQGQAVKRGEVLLILEAMKMENEITAPCDGVVSSLKKSEGASVATGEVLIELG
jgi:glutaconyl-CoA decarboxylase